MATRKAARTVATSLLVLFLAVPALGGVAYGNEPVPTPAPPPITGEGNVLACKLAHQQVRVEVIAEFRGNVQAALTANDLEKVATLVIELNDGLAFLRNSFAECLTRVTPTNAPRAGALAAKPKNQRGGGSGSTCLGTFDKAVKKATRSEDRSFRKKHNTVSPNVAVATFTAAVAAAAGRLQSCVGA